MKIDGISWGRGLLVDACWVQSLVVEINTYTNKSVPIKPNLVIPLNPSIQEAKAEELSLRPARAT